jgi:putative Mn2+ efflux pump MntP
MTKRTLDTFGGVGSILGGLMCVWFAQQHHQHEGIWKVWIGFCVFLVLNGIAMILYAHRPKRDEQVHHPETDRTLIRSHH